MGRHKDMYKPEPPKGLKEDYLSGKIPLTHLMRTYKISNTLIYKYISQLGWDNERIHPINIAKTGPKERGFSHLVGTKGIAPEIPSFSEMIGWLTNFPAHWRSPDFTPHNMGATQDTAYRLHLPR